MYYQIQEKFKLLLKLEDWTQNILFKVLREELTTDMKFRKIYLLMSGEVQGWWEEMSDDNIYKNNLCSTKNVIKLYNMNMYFFFQEGCSEYEFKDRFSLKYSRIYWIS